MEQEYAVVANNVSKVYRLYKNQNERIFDLLLGKRTCGSSMRCKA